MSERRYGECARCGGSLAICRAQGCLADRPRAPSPQTATNRLLPQGIVGRTASRAGVGRNVSRGQMLGDEIVGLYMKGLEDPNELLAMLQGLANVGTVQRGVTAGARVAAGQQTR